MRFFASLFSIMIVTALTACGGGTGSPGTNSFAAPPAAASAASAASAAATASDISLSLSAPTILNTPSATVTATVVAVDANRNTIAGIPVTISVDSDANVAVPLLKTDASGVVTGTISIGANRSNRSITVKALSGTISKTAVLQVTGTKITSVAVPAVVAPDSDGNKIQYKVVDGAGLPVPGQSITLTLNAVSTPGATDVNGAYEFVYKAPSTTGTLNINANSGGVDFVTSVLVQSVGTITPVLANSVRSATVRANPSVISVNAPGATSNGSEIRALFVGDNNQPIKNVRVRFDLNNDVNSIGGSFTTGSTLIYSDANGIALSTYVAGTRFSPTDGVTVRACWDYNDFTAGTCPNATTSTLTVIADPLSVTMGTDDLIGVGDLVYYQRFVIQVNDSSGLAKANVKISPLLDLDSYNKGYWAYNGVKWEWRPMATGCANEDLNRNGVLEVYSTGQAEDQNGNGQLDPRKADVAVSFEAGNTTDNTGRLILRITYPKSVASWVQFKLTIAASGISGTEGRASYSGTLGVDIDAIKKESDPAFEFSPYGIGPSPTVTLGLPGAPPSSFVTLCTNPN